MPAGPRIIIDEVQKVPALLDEVHRAIENQKKAFGLCGSSARNVRRGHANLLGGRALRSEMSGLFSAQLGGDFDLLHFLNRGTLPKHFLSSQATRLMRSYIADYIKESTQGLVVFFWEFCLNI